MSKQYSYLAGCYDLLNSDFNYEEYARFIDSEIRKSEKLRSSLVLDLGCGTGKITFALRDLGYDMTGVDISEEMLSYAKDICYDEGINDILWLCQDMREFELYGTVDACVCCLDSINYLTKLSDVEKCFSLVHNYLIPNGIFIFDVNTPYRFESVYGNNDYILENEGALCAWHNEYNEKSKICKFYLSLFCENEDGSYERFDEVQREKCYSMKQISSALIKNGFEIINIYGSLDQSVPHAESEKWYFVARCIK